MADGQRAASIDHGYLSQTVAALMHNGQMGTAFFSHLGCFLGGYSLPALADLR